VTNHRPTYTRVVENKPKRSPSPSPKTDPFTKFLILKELLKKGMVF